MKWLMRGPGCLGIPDGLGGMQASAVFETTLILQKTLCLLAPGLGPEAKQCLHLQSLNTISLVVVFSQKVKKYY